MILTLQGNVELYQLAKDWIKGKEVDLLRHRVGISIENFEQSDSYDTHLENDLESYAEELQMYATVLESIPVGILAELIEEYRSGR